MPVSTGGIEGLSSSRVAAGTILKREKVSSEDFLLLLVTQLRHQDPLEPLSSEEFLSQLAQFQNLEEVMDLNRTADRMLLGTRLTAASAMLGRHVRGLSALDGPLEGVVERVYIDGEDVYLDLGGAYLLVEEVIQVSPGPPGGAS